MQNEQCSEQDQGSLLLSLTILIIIFPLFAKMLSQLCLNAFIFVPVTPDTWKKERDFTEL